MPHLRSLFCRHKQPSDPKPTLVQAPIEGVKYGSDSKPAGASGLERDLAAESTCASSRVSVVRVDVIPTGVGCTQKGVGDMGLDEQKSLWDRAYDSLKMMDPDLVTRYEEVLSEKLDVGGTSPRGITLRREQLQTIIDANLQKTRGDKRDRLSQTTKVVLWAKDWIGEAVKSSPEASIAWAGISIVLPLLTNPATAQEANADGFTYVTSRMGFYSVFESVSLRRLGPSLDRDLLGKITDDVVGLFQHVLDFQIRSVLRFHGGWRALGRDMVGLDDWEGKLKKIKEFEHMLSRDLELVNDSALREEVSRVELTSKASLNQLQNLVAVHHEHLDVVKEQLKFQQLAAQQRLTDKERECHRVFRLIEGNKDVSYEWYKNRVENRVEGTCQWFLQHGNFGEWRGRTAGPLLVSADPGCGKSVLAKYLIDHVLPGSAPVCYFFFKDQDQNTIRQALCALLHQLFHHKPGLIKHAMSDFICDGEALAKNTTKMWEILGSAVRDPEAGQVILVLDALDECLESEFRELVKGIEALYRTGCKEKHCVKCLFTCRPYEQIVSEFRELLQEFPYIRIPGEEKSETISQEVDQVIQHRVRQLAVQKELSKAVEKCLLERLTTITHRTYLWVYLVFDHLKASDFKKTAKGVEAAIKSLPESVNQVYENMLNRAGEDKRSTIRKALEIVLAAQRPLSLAEMNIAMAVDDSLEKMEDLDLEDERQFYARLRSWCGLFLSVYQGKVYFLHQTAREFLMSGRQPPEFSPHSTLCWQGSVNFVEAHREIAGVCVTYIHLYIAAFGVERMFLPSDEDPDYYDYEVEEDFKLMQPEFQGEMEPELRDEEAFILYSVLYWPDHVREADLSRDDTLVVATAELYDAGVPGWLEKTGGLRDSVFEIMWREIPVSIFTLATYFQNESILNFFLENSSRSLNATDTILHLAVRCRSDAMVRFWIEKGADLEEAASDLDLGTPLMEAISIGDLSIVTLLLDSGANIQGLDPRSGQGPLHIACVNARREPEMLEIIRLLLGRGANTDSRDSMGLTPLHCLLGAPQETPYASYSADIIRTLLDSGMGIDVKDNRGNTALCYAVQVGTENHVIDTLVERGADLEARDELKRTPLFSILIPQEMHFDQSNIQELLQGGFGAGTGDADRENKKTAVAQKFPSSDILDLLISRGAQLDARDEDGRTVLHWAVAFDDEGPTLALLDRGADMEAKDSQGQTPLHFACTSNVGAPRAIYRLLCRGASLEARDNLGRTPLHLATSNVPSDITPFPDTIYAVQCLLDAGADCKAKDIHGHVALSPDNKAWWEERIRLLDESEVKRTRFDRALKINDLRLQWGWDGSRGLGNKLSNY